MPKRPVPPLHHLPTISQPSSLGLNEREYERLLVMQKLVRRDLTRRQAAQLLGLCVRQVHMLQRRFLEEGAKGLVSRQRGKRSNRAIADSIHCRAMRLARQRYAHLGPTRVREHLANRHGIRVSISTISNWMVTEGLWTPRSAVRKSAAPEFTPALKPPAVPGRYVPLLEDWVLDTETLVAVSESAKGVKRLRLRWYHGAIGWCESTGRYRAKQLKTVLDAARRHLAPELDHSRHWYVPPEQYDTLQRPRPFPPQPN